MASEPKPVGKITHYYDHIGVAVVEPLAKIKAGGAVRIEDRGNVFTQKVDSMQIEHRQVTEVKKGEGFGLKVDQAVKAGALVYLEEE